MRQGCTSHHSAAASIAAPARGSTVGSDALRSYLIVLKKHASASELVRGSTLRTSYG
jgi:hypothetical protein